MRKNVHLRSIIGFIAVLSLCLGAEGSVAADKSEAYPVSSKVGIHAPKLIEKAVLTCRKLGGKQEDFFVFTMTDVLVSRLKINGPDGNPESRDIQPYDQFSLSFAKIELSYKGQNVNGSLGAAVKGGYDLQRNVKI